MGICVSCGNEYDDGTGFCTYCGTEHSADGEAAAAGRPQAGPASTTSAVAPNTTRPTAVMHPEPHRSLRRLRAGRAHITADERL